VTFDEKYMNIAIKLAEKGIANSFPNPSVGCVIVECDKKSYNNDKIVGYGFTGKGGRPHAEAIAINRVSFRENKKYICFSSLEPCCHIGRDQSCVEKILKNPITEVVFAFKDPDKRVKGKGMKKLLKNGIIVRKDVLKNDAILLYKGYIMNKLKSRPYITLKIANSLDGKIAYPRNKIKWITNSTSRRLVHHIRSESDAILIGSNTLKVDNPSLDCRIKGLEGTSPIRIIISRKLDFSSNLNIFKSKTIKTIIFTTEKVKSNILDIKKKNVSIFQIKLDDFKLKFILKKIASIGVSNLLVEGGAVIFGLFLKEGLVDKLMIFRSNFFIGNDGKDSINEKSNSLINNCDYFKLLDLFPLNDNHIEIYENKITENFFKKNIRVL
jgi:diaminohydroxyphosphoribosylaminopyrimidine deaminase / 5-amino-6-(5-phosphoribosylamino)uracil reductase